MDTIAPTHEPESCRDGSLAVTHETRPGREDPHLAEKGIAGTAAVEVPASAPAREGAATAGAASLPPGTVLVLATADSLDIAARLRETEHALGSLERPVRTVLIDTAKSSPGAAAVHLAGSAAPVHRVLAAPGACWGSAIITGLAYARDLQAATVVLLGPDELADSSTQPRTAGVAAAVIRLETQKAPGVVCSPQARPWWQNPLSLHVLRPLCMPPLRFAPADALGATLVLSREAVTAALSHRSGLDRVTRSYPHALDVLAAARVAALTVSQAPARQPCGGHPQLDHAPNLSRAQFDAVVPAALRLSLLAERTYRISQPLAMIARAGVVAYPPPPGLLERMSVLCTEEARAGRASIGTWPEPLATAWHQARVLRPDYAAIAEELWPSYVRWCGRWFSRAAAEASPSSALDSAVRMAEHRTGQFLDAVSFGSTAGAWR